MKQKRIGLCSVGLASILSLALGCASIERKLLFYPTHRPADGRLSPWTEDGKVVGVSRAVDAPKNVWMMLPGNGGQAMDRAYAVSCFSPEDSIFILEYPGYGMREGVPSRESFDRAAREAYLFLRGIYPNVPLCVVGESIGSGPASSLAALRLPPDKFVLVVPFERLSLVAKDHLPSFLVGMILNDDWNNLSSLANYRGPVDIFGAKRDTVIPVEHAKALAAGIPSSKFILIEGNHNDWARQAQVKIRNP